MRWFYATIGLLLMSSCLTAWVYLRDRDTNWRLPEPQLAQADAALTLNNALDGADCRSDCAAEVLGRNGSHRWLVRIIVGQRSRCVLINLDIFTYIPQHGLYGVQPSRCTI
jgi:hypothetical protein